YQTCSVALAGRTFGMSLCALHAVDARKASVPTTGQCARRTLVYMLSLATLGLGLLYSLFDAEGRAAHDILSGTVVVRH
ncbi:MAG TPA: RDD family protein, partial [Pyrinomonadaceae bacterium]|nr:RDD family protein [Pyrinomonadaceae bacterium]